MSLRPLHGHQIISFSCKKKQKRGKKAMFQSVLKRRPLPEGRNVIWSTIVAVLRT